MMDTLLDRRSGQNGEPQRGVVPDAHREYQDDRCDALMDTVFFFCHVLVRVWCVLTRAAYGARSR